MPTHTLIPSVDGCSETLTDPTDPGPERLLSPERAVISARLLLDFSRKMAFRFGYDVPGKTKVEIDIGDGVVFSALVPAEEGDLKDGSPLQVALAFWYVISNTPGALRGLLAALPKEGHPVVSTPV